MANALVHPRTLNNLGLQYFLRHLKSTIVRSSNQNIAGKFDNEVGMIVFRFELQRRLHDAGRV
jgi:hypothetical protein